MDKTFWRDKRVFVTGHTGFKGSWLTLCLKSLGAKVLGYSLDLPSIPNLFTLASVHLDCDSIYADICNYNFLLQSIKNFKPDIVFHMAAQPLVRKSYKDPLATFNVNLMGTANILEASRQVPDIKVVINITTDKCYENQGIKPCREGDPLGGYDPYSASKACSELITSAYLRSYFQDGSIRLASVRAGNVIGGGDFAEDRIFPDLVRSIINKEKMLLRNPNAIRPWQHVLDPLNGYIILAERLWLNNDLAGPWNFGPQIGEELTVQETIVKAIDYWDIDHKIKIENIPQPHEALFLRLDSSKANKMLSWSPKLNSDTMIALTVDWYKNYLQSSDVRVVTLSQIKNMCNL